ncbi:probable RNA-binding protein EIF1AD isoform X1 [Polistes fuscatus]|uniref:probable RNA-binding protein EIF1AD isoform X1 n=1 Tax=Polistes fuscatus TaxID=30207 RepID=UPI001CA9A011|nr:probable RNA-binding protein EIF1AD isoform X1 [Polistes fuscatus]XP_043492655.1 probable RNA-binding protein EIF1AD isoform X1 [Polistes fuscatus]
MSKATKRKHVVKEVEEFSFPTESQLIVKVVGSRGNNLHEIINSVGEQYLVSMPVKFRRHIWIKAGDFVLVEPIAEGDKVKAEIVKILTREHIKWYRAQKCWPLEFDEIKNKKQPTKTIKNNSDDEEEEEEEDNDDDLFVNTNRIRTNVSNTSSDSDTSSDESDQ